MDTRLRGANFRALERTSLESRDSAHVPPLTPNLPSSPAETNLIHETKTLVALPSAPPLLLSSVTVNS